MLPVRQVLLACLETSDVVESTIDVACKNAYTRLTKLLHETTQE